MEFNVQKCKVMHIGNSNKNFKYYMDGNELDLDSTGRERLGVDNY